MVPAVPPPSCLQEVTKALVCCPVTLDPRLQHKQNFQEMLGVKTQKKSCRNSALVALVLDVTDVLSEECVFYIWCQ